MFREKNKIDELACPPGSENQRWRGSVCFLSDRLSVGGSLESTPAPPICFHHHFNALNHNALKD